jgi:hypothetical protein
MKALQSDRRTRRWLTSLAAAGAGLSVLAEPLLAQTRARLPGEDKGMWQWAVAGAIAVLCLVTAFINPKRSHRS